MDEQTDIATDKIEKWPAHNEAPRRRLALTIWFDPETPRDAAPTGSLAAGDRQ